MTERMTVVQTRVKCKQCKVYHVVAGLLNIKVKKMGVNVRIKYVVCPTCGTYINLGPVKNK